MDFSPLIIKNISRNAAYTITLIGGGGKSTLLEKLGIELSLQHQKVLLTSTVKSGPTSLIPIQCLQPTDRIQPLLNQHNPLFVMKEKVEKEKYIGFAASEIASWVSSVDYCLIEGDGARKLPLKAHTDYDPNIPDYSDQVIIIIGADVVDTSLSDGLVHRPDQFKSLWGIESNTRLDPDFISEVVTSDKGYLTKFHHPIPTTFIVNKADMYPTQAQSLALSIKKKNRGPVFWGSVQDHWIKEI